MRAAGSITLERIMPPRLGLVVPSEFPNEIFDLYSIPAFDQGEPEILEGAQIGSAKQIVQPGDVLLSRIVPHIRRAWVVGHDRGRRIIASGEWIIFRGETVDASYLRHVLVSDPFHAEFMRTVSGVGGSLLRARPAYVAQIRIPLPALPEQRRIAAILDKADELRAKRRAAIAKLDSLTQSIFLDMFGDPATNPKGWPMLTLKQVLTIPLRNGLSPSKVGKVLAQVLTLSAITGSAFDDEAWKVSTFLSSPPGGQSVSSKDFLICRGNGNIKLVGRGQFPTCSMPKVTFPDTMIAARVSDQLIEPSFLQHVWNSIGVRQQIESLARTTNGTFKVNQTMLEWIMFISPPMPLQRQFTYSATAIEETKKKEYESLAGLHALFEVLQHRAFRGEL